MKYQTLQAVAIGKSATALASIASFAATLATTVAQVSKSLN
jgi:hypothetical protein